MGRGFSPEISGWTPGFPWCSFGTTLDPLTHTGYKTFPEKEPPSGNWVTRWPKSSEGLPFPERPEFGLSSLEGPPEKNPAGAKALRRTERCLRFRPPETKPNPAPGIPEEEGKLILQPPILLVFFAFAFSHPLPHPLIPFLYSTGPSTRQ
jgi:hypothetical protein